MATHAVIGGENWHDWRMQFPQAAVATEGLILLLGSGVNYRFALTALEVKPKMDEQVLLRSLLRRLESDERPSAFHL